MRKSPRRGITTVQCSHKQVKKKDPSPAADGSPDSLDVTFHLDVHSVWDTGGMWSPEAPDVCENMEMRALMCLRENTGRNSRYGNFSNGMNSSEKQPGGYIHDGPCTPEPGTALGEGDALAVGMQPLTPPKTRCVSCFVIQLFSSSMQICFPAKRTKTSFVQRKVSSIKLRHILKEVHEDLHELVTVETLKR